MSDKDALYTPYTLTRDDVRSLASIFAECDRNGFDDDDNWFSADQHHEYVAMRDVLLALYRDLVRAEEVGR